MLLPAPRIDEVLPPLLEFIGGAVIVGHNIRFDISFLDAALAAHGYPKLEQRRVDTIGLARRLVRDEVPDLKLGTLARHLRVSVSPCHRAFADAAATAEVLHALLERAGHLRRPRARRPARAAVDPCAPVGEQAAAHRPPPPPSRRLPDEGPRRPHPLRRQGHQPPGPRPLVLRRRRPPEGAAAPAARPRPSTGSSARTSSRRRCESSGSSRSSSRASTGRASGGGRPRT